MITTISDEVIVFLWSVLSGVLIMIVYDILTLAANTEKYSILVCNIFDAIFITCASTIMIFVLFSVSNGYIRSYEFVGAFIGGFLYKLTISPIFVAVLTKITSCILAVFKIFLKILLTPIKFMYKIICNTISVLCRFVRKLLSPITCRVSRFLATLKITLKKT